MSNATKDELTAPSPVSVSSFASNLHADEYPRRDFWAGIIFCINLGVTIIMALTTLVFGLWRLEEVGKEVIIAIIGLFVVNVFVSIVMATGLAIVGLFLFRRHPLLMVQVGYVSLATLLLLLALPFAMYGYPSLALFLTVVALLVMIFFYRARRSFNMSGALVALIASAESSNLSLYSVLIAAALAAYYYTLLITAPFLAIIGFMQQHRINVLLILTVGIYLVFSWLWTLEVLLFVVRAVIAGTFEQYFGGDSGRTRLNTFQIVQLALTRCIGSLCLGALLVFQVTNVRWCLQVLLGLPYNTPFLAPPARNYNYYAVNGLVFRGLSYRESANRAWDDIFGTGVVEIVNGSCVGQMLTTCAFSISLITGIFSALALLVISPGYSFLEALGSGTFSAFCIGFGIAVYLFKVMDAGVVAIFVILAQNPEGVRKKHPRMFEAISNYYHISA